MSAWDSNGEAAGNMAVWHARQLCRQVRAMPDGQGFWGLCVQINVLAVAVSHYRCIHCRLISSKSDPFYSCGIYSGRCVTAIVVFGKHYVVAENYRAHS
jgi:hypothetical protein